MLAARRRKGHSLVGTLTFESYAARMGRDATHLSHLASECEPNTEKRTSKQQHARAADRGTFAMRLMLCLLSYVLFLLGSYCMLALLRHP